MASTNEAVPRGRQFLSMPHLQYIIHHVILPPQLPHGDDYDVGAESTMLQLVLGSLLHFKSHLRDTRLDAVDSAIAMVRILQDLRSSSGIAAVIEEKLLEALKALGKHGGTIPLHIRAQNAGVLISQSSGNVHIEMFELSPHNNAVMSTKGRLRRSFPGSAVAIPFGTYSLPGLQATLAHTLATMSHQTAHGTQPKAAKAKQLHNEDRDTTHPKMVTEFLSAFLMSMGSSVEVKGICKNTREEVSWKDKLLPWHRSSLWLLIRVTLHLHFSRSAVLTQRSDDTYKEFMVFLMADILDQSHSSTLSSDILLAMTAKVHRRYLKLAPSAMARALHYIEPVMRKANGVLERRWSQIQELDPPTFDLSRLEHPKAKHDTLHIIHNLDRYITAMLSRQQISSSITFQLHSSLPTFSDSLSMEKIILDLTGQHTVWKLLAFESWVASSLDVWLACHTAEPATCAVLRHVMEIYHAAAFCRYKDNPEAMSVMLITSLELWVACDKLVTRVCSLLSEYEPAIPRELLQSLNLPYKDQMERLQRIERYLTGRCDRAHLTADDIFTKFGHPTCFPVRFFDQSSQHQDLLVIIETRANSLRQQKLQELDMKKGQYNEFMRQANSSEHEYFDLRDHRTGLHRRQHRNNCKKCQYAKKAEGLTIMVDEWPLPTDQLEKKSTVFELRVPAWFGHWRDSTVYILSNILGLKYPLDMRTTTTYTPQRFDGLSSYFQKFYSTQTIGLLSETKPHIVTHRREKHISQGLTRDDVCVKNGLRYQYHDNTKGCFVQPFQTTPKLAGWCTYQLPEKSASLQQFIDRTASRPEGPSPNTVIAAQWACPDNLSLDEYKALASLPLGYRIQWRNILLQLTSPSIDFKKEETGLMILQCIFQAGHCSCDSPLRDSHIILDNEEFGHTLLDSLHEALQRVQENWQSSHALASFISVAARLLSLASNETIRHRCRKFLEATREITLSWVGILKDKADLATDDDMRSELRSKAVIIALICTNSFNVDHQYLRSDLASAKHASALIQCAIVIQEGLQTITDTSTSTTSILRHRWERLSYRTVPILSQEIVQSKNTALNDAIKKSWSSYQASGKWRALKAPYHHWLVTETLSGGGGNTLAVHYSLLTGELLVNGVPLDRLPLEYQSDPMYSTLFGRSTLEVMPTSSPGMRFSGKKDFAGHNLQFGLGNCGDESSDMCLLVQATTKEGQRFELVPKQLLRPEFPTAFVAEYVHWYNVTDEYVELCPKEHPWDHSEQNWKLVRDKSLGGWRMVKEGSSLVRMKSTTARVLSKTFESLEDLSWTHVILDPTSRSLTIKLPRLQLVFYLELGQHSIKSRQFRGLSVAENQSIGTLVGLRNKLVLKSEQGNIRSKVLVPNGGISNDRLGEHVCVTLAKSSATKVHVYEVDDKLCTLIDDGSLQSKLLLAYLHALTSYCLPDPLTRKTGTEEALTILRSAAIRSSNRITQENIHLLVQIASLTPGREYYPANARVMQRISWSSHLSFLAQHGAFYEVVRSILDRAERSKFFYPDSYIDPPALQRMNRDLLDRDNIRTSTFRVSGFGAEDHTVEHDTTYSSRDHADLSTQGYQAFAMSKAIFLEGCGLPYIIKTDLAKYVWDFLSGGSCDDVVGPKFQFPIDKLKYDAELLLKARDIVTKQWVPLHETLKSPRSRPDKFQVMIWLATLSFANDADITIIQTLATFYTVANMASFSAPPRQSFRVRHGYKMDVEQLVDVIRPFLCPFTDSPEGRVPRCYGESDYDFEARQLPPYRISRNACMYAFAKALMQQWPRESPYLPVDPDYPRWQEYINIHVAMEKARALFKPRFENYLLLEYLGMVEVAMPRQVLPVAMPSLLLPTPTPQLSRPAGFLRADDIVTCSAPMRPAPPVEDATGVLSSEKRLDDTEATPHLHVLLKRLNGKTNSLYEKGYMRRLMDSLLSLQGWNNKQGLTTSTAVLRELLSAHRDSYTMAVNHVYSAMLKAIHEGQEARGNKFLSKVPDSISNGTIQQWPRISPTFFLQHLSRHRWDKLQADWQGWIVSYGVALTKLQRAERLLDAVENIPVLKNELRNPGHTNWNPRDHPEALLMEVESGIMIREVQEQIASTMMQPPSSKNAVMQLNMGEGKSSVIVPRVAAALADGCRLVRIIVAKPQSKQMFQMLLSKFGGLLDRQIYQVPFSRAVKLSRSEADAIQRIFEECRETGGVLLIQPEHILSFKLMGIECTLTGKGDIARAVLESQAFLDLHSRDVVDESDENFSTKFELVYTMGTQRPIEHSPGRWTYIHQVLNILRKITCEVQTEFPHSVEVHSQHPGCFPRTRILRQDAQNLLLSRIAESICDTGLGGFPVARQLEAVRLAILRYITTVAPTEDDVKQVEDQSPEGFWNGVQKDTLLLLRGLIAGGVLAFCFSQKRWRVDYGLDANRKPQTRLAVPFRAKDNPSARSEFSHPDVVILLTSLSYYYGGISDDDLFLTLQHLIKSDQAELDYQGWVQDAPGLSSAFEQLDGINLEDRFQCTEHVFPHLRYSKGAIDYFLAQIVFPKEMKEFPHKLSASGWDIGEVKTHPTTGFSGTNDSRQVLPLDVGQLDLEGQRHTNALVLEYLLQRENSVTPMPQRREADESDAEVLLEMVTKLNPSTRVILDVGAQILELDNIGVAKAWLSKMHEPGRTEAVVFFDDHDDICVLDGMGHVEPLQTSSYLSQMDMCLVFLDEAHTRGTDLKLPQNYRAAVTLGANLTKDRLVQACMRMRLLGKGQSVVFCVPEEIQIKIREHVPGCESVVSTEISVSDILFWVITETWADLKRNMPLWATQGRRYMEHGEIWSRARSNGDISLSEDEAEKFLEDEAQSLETRYRPRHDALEEGVDDESPDPITLRCREFNNLRLSAAALQEEQERELSPEIEQEREDQRPPPAQPAVHAVHRDIQVFVASGNLVPGSKAYMPAFMSLSETSAAASFDVSQFPAGLLVTADFATTIGSTGRSYVSDSYQRPVQWILTSGHRQADVADQMMIISPFEAEQLCNTIESSKHVALHLYAPRPNLGVRPLDGLDLYTVPKRLQARQMPRSLIVELNLYAGQLYLRSYHEYIEVCKFLGLAWDKTGEGETIAADGFILRDGAGRVGGESGLQKSPIEFFKVLLTKIRRNCEGIEKTHMGRLLDNQLLTPDEFQPADGPEKSSGSQ